MGDVYLNALWWLPRLFLRLKWSAPPMLTGYLAKCLKLL
jgi:hypothetical protein